MRAALMMMMMMMIVSVVAADCNNYFESVWMNMGTSHVTRYRFSNFLCSCYTLALTLL
jgi:hypothetical protein